MAKPKPLPPPPEGHSWREDGPAYFELRHGGQLLCSAVREASGGWLCVDPVSGRDWKARNRQAAAASLIAFATGQAGGGS